MKIWVVEESIDYEGIVSYDLFQDRNKGVKELRKKISNKKIDKIKDDFDYITIYGSARIFEREVK